MNYNIEYSAKAQSDLDEIYRYIAFSLMSPDVAANVYREIVNNIRSLESMPMRNPLIDEEPWKSRGLRKLIVKNFIVFYTAYESSVKIVRIMYGGRNINVQLNK